MADDARPRTRPQSSRGQPPARPPRTAVGFGDDDDEYGSTESESGGVLVEFTDIAISDPAELDKTARPPE